MDLVVGATGNLGRVICKHLRQRDHQVRALVREHSDPAVVEELRRLGVQTVTGDLKDPTSLQAACADVDHVVSTASSTLSRAPGDDVDSVDRRGQLELLDAAVGAGVSHFVFVSFPETSLAFPLQDAKRAVETALVTSGLAYTVLRPPHFLEGWFGPALGFDIAGARARVFADGTGKMSWVSMFDVARIAALCTGNARAQHRMLAFGGPAPTSQREVTALFENAIGRRFEVENVPIDLLKQQLASARSPLERSFAALMLIAGTGDDWRFDNADLRGIIDFDLTPASDFVRAACAAIRRA